MKFIGFIIFGTMTGFLLRKCGVVIPRMAAITVFLLLITVMTMGAEVDSSALQPSVLLQSLLFALTGMLLSIVCVRLFSFLTRHND